VKPEREHFDVAVVGAGPAGLRAAEVAALSGARVCVIEAGRTPGRKFLLAGRSGLNLTHSEPFPSLVSRYGADAERLREILHSFSPTDVQAWSAGLGEPCQVGSSGRIFPKSWRAAPLLRAWLTRLDALGVTVRTQTRWTGFVDNTPSLTVQTVHGTETIGCAVSVLACGGASWPRTGSDGSWLPALSDLGVTTVPFGSSNAGLRVEWSPHVLAHSGEPIKDVALRHGNGPPVRGDLVIVNTGFQGGPAYSLASLVDQQRRQAAINLFIDVRPDLTEDVIAERLHRRRPGESSATLVKRLFGFPPATMALLNEWQRLPVDPIALADHLKNLVVPVTGADPIDRAISSTGGLAWTALSPELEILRLPGVFAAGEMIAWDAPTGGYLLQACLSTGGWAGRHAARFSGHLGNQRPGFSATPMDA
jgi:uncharacterized flavoprotein (TIGR03862 family)